MRILSLEIMDLTIALKTQMRRRYGQVQQKSSVCAFRVNSIQELSDALNFQQTQSRKMSRNFHENVAD